MAQVHTAICRFCHSFCGVNVTIDNGKVTNVLGDIENPMYHGYTCIKGRQLADQHYHLQRLLAPQKRTESGHVKIGSTQALDEIAQQLQQLIDAHGPRSVAMYTGT